MGHLEKKALVAGLRIKNKLYAKTLFPRIRTHTPIGALLQVSRVPVCALSLLLVFTLLRPSWYEMA